MRDLAAQHFAGRPYPSGLPPVRVLSGLDGAFSILKLTLIVMIHWTTM